MCNPFHLLFFSFRLYGSYEALEGGLMSESLTDLTGGIAESYILRGRNANCPQNIVRILQKAMERCALIGCGINVSITTD